MFPYLFVCPHAVIRELWPCHGSGRRPLTEMTRVWCLASPCGICDGHSGTGRGSSPSISSFLCCCHFTSAPYSYFV